MSYELLDHELQEIYASALDVAKKAGVIIKEAFTKEKKVETKACDIDLVTETDQAVEKHVFEIIQTKYPNHKFIGEETSSTTGQKCELTDAPTWIVDPVDGTSNFVHSIQETAFSLGITVNKKPVIGIVYVPVKDELFSALIGQGAFLNGQRLHTSSVKDLKKSMGIMEAGTIKDSEVLKDKIDNIHSVVMNCHGVRSYGSCAVNLCHIAAGRGDFYVEYGVHIWDYVAGALIAQEAGATVRDPEGGELNLLRRRVLAACTEELANQIPSILKHLDFGTD